MQTATATRDHHLIASDRVEGTKVYSLQGEKLGTVVRFMVDKATGRAEFVLIQFGGLLGLGADHFPIPWSMLSYDPDRGGYVVNLDIDQVREGPRHGDMPPAYDRDYQDMVTSYYRNRPAPFI
jgi:hypothetical protein